MGIHLRTYEDEDGEFVDYAWFCSRWCYTASFGEDVSAEFEGADEGGAYPGGAEHDDFDLCATCAEPIGNPLTPEGEKNVREACRGTDRVLADALRQTYDYLFWD